MLNGQGVEKVIKIGVVIMFSRLLVYTGYVNSKIGVGF